LSFEPSGILRRTTGVLIHGETYSYSIKMLPVPACDVYRLPRILCCVERFSFSSNGLLYELRHSSPFAMLQDRCPPISALPSLQIHPVTTDPLYQIRAVILMAKNERIPTKFLLCCLLMVALLLVFLASGCDDTINPTAPFKAQMVVYSILTTQSDTQYVRVYSSYNPPEMNPSNTSKEIPITDAQVTITQGNRTFVFRDTVIRRPHTSRYNNDLHLYYCYPMRVEPNTNYSLQVTSPTYGSASSTVRVPNVASLYIATPSVLSNPVAQFGQPVLLTYSFFPTLSAYLVRFYIVYTDENPWDPPALRGKEKYFEVPYRRIALNRNLELCTVIYPQLTKLEPALISPVPGSGNPKVLGFTFPFSTYNESIAAIRRYNFNVRFKRAVFYVIQFDQPYYRYYSIVNNYRDKLAIRLDEPDYTNILGGSGLFASIRVDSTSWDLPEFIAPGPSTYNPVYCQQEVPQIAPKFDPLSWRIP
jgi:hypothetical protein